MAAESVAPALGLESTGAAALVRIASFGLPTTLEPIDQPLSDTEWGGFVAGLQQHRLSGLAAAAIDSGAMPTTGDQYESLVDLDVAWQQHVLRAEALLLEILAVLEAAGVSWRLLKGPALAHTVYDDPSLRVFGDLDILVPGHQLAITRSVLATELGGIDPMPELRPGFDAEFAKDVLLRVRSIEVDLHRTLAAGPFGLQIPVEELFDSPGSVPLGSQQIPTLNPLHTFMHVCYNAALGDIPPRLMSLRDVAQVQARLQLDSDEILETAARWQGSAVVARAVDLTWSTFALAPNDLSAWATSYRPGRLERRLMAASTSTRRSYTRQLAALRAIPGLRARLRYVRAITAPGPEYLAARHWTRRSHLRRAFDRLRPRRRR